MAKYPMERATAQPLIIEATENNPRLELHPIGPRELGAVRQQIRAERLDSVREYFKDNFGSAPAREALKAAVNGAITIEDVDSFLSDVDGTLFLIHMSLKRGGSKLTLTQLQDLDVPQEVWDAMVNWLWRPVAVADPTEGKAESPASPE